MTTAALADPAESLEQRLQSAVITALDTLVALATSRDDPRQARLAAAEILRFASRRRPETPRPHRERAGSAGAITRGLDAMLDLLHLAPTPAAPDVAAAAADPEPAAPTSGPRAIAPVDPVSLDLVSSSLEPELPPAHHGRSDEQAPGRPSEPGSPPSRPRFTSARKRKRERQRAARSQSRSGTP